MAPRCTSASPIATKRSTSRTAWSYLPTLLALSASSPFASDGSDTGYSSMRTLIWQRWPTTGPAAPVQSAQEYDELVNDLVASGVISDVGMVYFDVRPASCAPTGEPRCVRQLPFRGHRCADRRATPGSGRARGCAHGDPGDHALPDGGSGRAMAGRSVGFGR